MEAWGHGSMGAGMLKYQFWNFTILSFDGREILDLTLSPGQKRFEWAPLAEVYSATYFLRLGIKNRFIKTGKFIRLYCRSYV